ncbi:hypothetical protein MUP00_02975 [Candidatus Bathyarchaeota archaeon]|nr:hypothetical protein [Candidatus Bathyarchaeota archaeon]
MTNYSPEKRVALARGDRGKLVEDALDLIDVPRELKPTTRVFIKPNLVRVARAFLLLDRQPY